MNQSQADHLHTESRPSPPGGIRIGFVQAGWHADIVEQGYLAFVESLGRAGVDPAAIDHIHVPGSFEIPLEVKKRAATGRYDLIAAAGLITDGGIYRHEFVAGAVINGLMQVQLETGTPVLSMVLTPHHFHDHDRHRDFFLDHFRVKGEELAGACLAVLGNLDRLGDAA